MSLQKLFEFPTILITIGIILLIVSIFVILLAVKTDKRENTKFEEFSNDVDPNIDSDISNTEQVDEAEIVDNITETVGNEDLTPIQNTLVNSEATTEAASVSSPVNTSKEDDIELL